MSTTGLPSLKDAALERDARIAVLTFQRDDVRNALTGTALVDDICATLEWANACEDLSVLILSGAGSAFSAGGNIKVMRERSGTATPFELEKYYRLGIQRIPLAMRRAEVATIASENGPSKCPGFDLANMCDSRVASSAAQFAETFNNLSHRAC